MRVFQYIVRKREERLIREIADLEDRELVQRAFDAFWRGSGRDLDVDSRVRLVVLKPLREAAGQLNRQLVLSMETRGQVRSILLNERLRD